MNTTKHELYRLYQTNKNLEVFLNTFLQLSKKAKIDDSQALDMLYKKLSNEFKDRLVTVKKAKNLNNLILLLRNMNANMKKISKQSQLCAKPNASNFPATKPPFKSYNSTLTKHSTNVGVAIAFPVSSTAIETYTGPIDVSNMIKQGPILQKEKDTCNSLGLCRHCGKSGHITIDHKNPALMAIKKQAAGVFMGNLMALVPYKSLPMEEKETFLS